MPSSELPARPVQIGRVSTVEALEAALRKLILGGEFAPGTQLREVELAGSFGVGRHSLRAALQLLVQQGLLSHEPNRGVFVPQLDQADVRDLFILRTAVESEAARHLAVEGSSLDAAIEVVTEMEAFTGQEPWNEIVEVDLRFHRALIGAVGSGRMNRAFASLQSEMGLLLRQLSPQYDKPTTVGARHRAVTDAIQSGDPDRAVAVIRAHIDVGVQDLLHQQ